MSGQPVAVMVRKDEDRLAVTAPGIHVMLHGYCSSYTSNYVDR